jgi:hypothetical protein
MGKFQKVKKVKRELKELKICFPNLSLEAIKEEAVPLILASITNYLNEDGQNSLDSCIALLKHYHITNEKFKENILDLQSKESILKRFEKVSPALKAALTRKLNEKEKSSVIHKKKREASGADKVKYDEEGNIREVFEDDEEEEDDDEDVALKPMKGNKTITKGKKLNKD